MHTVTESIFSGETVIIPHADVQHIENRPAQDGILVITKHTRWDFEQDNWANNIWLYGEEAKCFVAAWCRYRSELEADTLMDLSPSGESIMAGFDRAIDALKRA